MRRSNPAQWFGFWLAVAIVSLPSREAHAGTSLLVAPATKGGSRQCCEPIQFFRFQDTGPLMQLPTLQTPPEDDPIFMSFNAQGELFVGNAKGVELGLGGSISRFKFDASLNPQPNGIITGNGLDGVHGVAIRSTGELFACNNIGGRVCRFIFDAKGTAIPNGGFVTGNFRNGDVAFTPADELLVSTQGPTIQRYRFDANGVPVLEGAFDVPGAQTLCMAFNAKGDLFVSSPGTDQIFHYGPVTPGQAPALIGTIPLPGLPCGLAFTPAGQLFVGLNGTRAIVRLGFDAAGNASTLETTPVINVGALAVYTFGTTDSAGGTGGSPTGSSTAGGSGLSFVSQIVSSTAQLTLPQSNASCVYLVKSTAGGTQGFLTLPPVRTSTNRLLTIRRVDALSAVFLRTAPGETVLGGPSVIPLKNIYDHVTLASDGTNWLLINHRP